MTTWHLIEAGIGVLLVVGFIIGTVVDDWSDRRAGPLR